MNRYILASFGIILAVLFGFVLYNGSVGFSTVRSVGQTQIVELADGEVYDLTASYVTKEIGGVSYKMLAYNGMIPGPTIRVAQGAQVTINFKNDTDMPAALHSHGVRMDNAYDGAVPTSQQEIPPRGTFTYKLKFPDAGVYWYHPHVNEVYQQALGLYGAFVVVPKDTGYFPPANSEHVLFLSDLPIVNDRIDIARDGSDQALMGHYGNVLLVNGEEDFAFSAQVGEVLQLYIINASNARPYNLAIDGARLKLIGGDSGAYERAMWKDAVVLGPSERVIVQVMFSKAGTYELQNKIPSGTTALGRIVVSDGTVDPSYMAQFNTLQQNKEVQTSVDVFRRYFNKVPDKKIVLSVDFSGMMQGHMQGMGGMNMGGMHAMHGQVSAVPDDGIEWDTSDQMMTMMNKMSTIAETKWKVTDTVTNKSNMDIHWMFTRNEPVKIEIYNDPNSMHPMQHPIHFHGQRFLVLSINGVKQTNLVWKDTTLVPAGARVEILLDPTNPGIWMAHCHIAEHLQSGMMFMFEVM